MMEPRLVGNAGVMIAMLAMSSTVRAALACLAAPAGGLRRSGCRPTARRTQPLATHPVPDEVFTMPDGTRLPARVWLPPDGRRQLGR